MSETMLKEAQNTPLPNSPQPQPTPPAPCILDPNLNPVSIFTAYFASLDTLRTSTTQHTTILARLTNLSNPNTSLSDPLLLQAKIAINDQILQAYHDFNTEWGWMNGRLMVRLLDLAGVVLEEDQESKIREFDDGMKEYKEEEMLVREHGWIWRRWVLGMQGLGGAGMEREREGTTLGSDLNRSDLCETRNGSAQGVYRRSCEHRRRSDLLSSLGGRSEEDSDAESGLSEPDDVEELLKGGC